MLKRKSHFTLAVVLVAAVMLLAGGVAMASNTGFKINKPVMIAGAGQIGNNWTAIPYFNPYGNAAALCTQTGLSSAGIGSRGVITKLNPVTGISASATCGTGPAATLLIEPGLGVLIRNAGNISFPAPTSIIIVGSHNPALSVTVPAAGAGAIGDTWLSVPYHTTAVTAADLCASSGLVSTGLSRATVTRLNGVTGTSTSASCGTAAAGTLNLVLGEAVRIRQPLIPATFIPAHF